MKNQSVYSESVELAYSVAVEDAKKELSGFDYLRACKENGVESADMQLERLKKAVYEAEKEYAGYLVEHGY